MDPGNYFQEGFRERPARTVPAPGEAGGKRPRTRRTRPPRGGGTTAPEPVGARGPRAWPASRRDRAAAIHSCLPARSPGPRPVRCEPSRDRYTARPVRPSRARSATPRPPPSPSMRVPSGLLPAREYLSPAAAIPTAIGFRPRSRPTLQGAAPSFLDSAPSYACLAANRCPSWSRLPSRMFMLVLPAWPQPQADRRLNN